jgi:flagellar protein FlaI
VKLVTHLFSQKTSVDKDQIKRQENSKTEINHEYNVCNNPLPLYKYNAKGIIYKIIRTDNDLVYCVQEENPAEDYQVEKRKSGYGELYPLIIDENVEEISVNGPGKPVYILNRLIPGIWLRTNIELNEEEADSMAYNLAVKARRSVSLLTPMAEGLTSEGYRVSVTFSKEVSRWGSSFVIRKYPSDPPSITQLIEQNVLTSLMAAYLWFLIDHKKFILITGGMGAGKTTFLNALIELISPYSKILTIEDTPEIKVLNSNWDSLITRPVYPGSDYAEITLFDLVKFSLRRRSDYIIIGEVRGREALGLAQAVATGQGSLATFHADSPRNALERLMMDPINLSPSFTSLIDVIVHLKKTKKKGVIISRRVETLVEQTDNKLIPLFKWHPRTDLFTPDSIEDLIRTSKIIEKIMNVEGYTTSELVSDLVSRLRLLETHRGESRREFRRAIEEFYSSRVNDI